MIVSNLTSLLYFSLLYIVGLSFLYFSKARMKNLENRIYKFLLVLNVFGIILQIGCDYVSVYYDILPIVFSSWILKLYLAYFVAWLNTILDYVLSLVFFGKRKVIWFNIVLTVVESIIVMILPFNLFIDSHRQVYYSYGVAINATFVISGILMVLMFLLIITNIRKISKKKVAPIFLLMFFGIIAAIIQKNNPSAIIIAPMETFICALMYFTIENPDIKMIEQLNMAKDQADKANRAKTDFLSSMSHEIRTPLNAIVEFSECVKQSETLEEARENANDIVNASNTLLEIVNGILDISKIEAGKIEIHNSSYNSKELFDSIVKLGRGRLGEKPLDFRVDIAPDIPDTLYGDHANVKKVIINILTNAIKYTDKGFIDFSIKCVKTDDICRLIISVEDSGRGIKEKDIDKLFTKFQRLDEDRNTTIEGTGLGLAITKQLVDLMGGKIVVQSKYGEGSKFTIALDQKISQTKVETQNIEITDNLDLTGKNILIVDDNKLNLKVASKILARYNPNIDTVESGIECIEKINSGNKYDLILMDDMMPRMSGGETLLRLKQIENFNIPVVVLTANALEGMREQYLNEGFNEYLSKPINKQELNRILKLLLSENKDKSLDKQINEIDKSENIEQNKEIVSKVEGAYQGKIEIPKQFSSIYVTKDDNKKTIDYLKDNNINVDYGIGLLGDINTYNETLEEFYNNINNKLLKLIEFKNNSDMTNYMIEVHALKSDSKYLGFTSLANISFDHEMASKENNLEFINNNFDQLLNETNRLVNIIKIYLGK